MTARTATFLLLLFVPLAGAAADEEAARFFTGRGEEELEAENWREAEEQFRKALKEHRDHLPAVFGLAQAADGREAEEEAVGFLETCLDIAESRKLTEAEEEIVEEAEEMLERLDRPRLEYRRIRGGYVRRLLALAESSLEKDRELTRRCVERILAVEPDHDRARAIMKEIGPRKTPAAEGPGPVVAGKERAIFNGQNLSNWADAGPIWRVEKGVIAAEIGEAAYSIRSKEYFKGDYAFEFEMRMTKDTFDVPRVSLRFGVQDEYDCFALDVYESSFTLSTYEGNTDNKKLDGVDYYVFSNDFDRTEWNTYRIAVKDDNATVSVNGRKLFEHLVEPGEYDGYIGLVVQHCAAEFRRIAKVPE